MELNGTKAVVTRGSRGIGFEICKVLLEHGAQVMAVSRDVRRLAAAREALVELRDRGLTKWIGITGHGPDVPQVLLEALRRFDFDTIMSPVSASMYRNAEYRRDAELLLETTNERNVGVQAIKMLARGGWGDCDRECATWYDPHREQRDIDRALWWLLSQPVHTAPSTGDVHLLPKVMDAAGRFRPLQVREQEEVVDAQHPPLPEPRLAIMPVD